MLAARSNDMADPWDLIRPEMYGLLAGVALVVASWAARIRLFCRDTSDKQLAELLEDTYPTTFQDSLAFQLMSRWRRLTAESRRAALPFVVLYSVAGCLILLAMVSAFTRHFLLA